MASRRFHGGWVWAFIWWAASGTAYAVDSTVNVSGNSIPVFSSAAFASLPGHSFGDTDTSFDGKLKKTKQKKVGDRASFYPEGVRVALADVGAGAVVTDATSSDHPEARTQGWPIPATTGSTPAAYGAQWTDVYAGVAVQSRSRFNTLPNGTAVVGFGLGDAARRVGLDVAILSYGLSRHGHPYRTGGINLKVHRYFREPKLAVAIGFENLVMWNDPDNGRSVYAVASRHFQLRQDSRDLFGLLFLHAGIGNGRFRGETDFTNDVPSWNPFFAVGLRVKEPLGIVFNWTGLDLDTGVSVTPFRRFPLSIGLFAMDVAGRAGDGVRWAMSLSFSDSVKSPTFPVGWFRNDG